MSIPNPEHRAADAAERRWVLRTPAECNALLRLSENLTFRCTLRNISQDAVQVVCDTRYALLIHPRGAEAKPDANRLVDISIALPDEGEVRGLKARCRVKYCVPLHSDTMALGLQFVGLDAASVHLLDDYIGSV